ncbi:MAG TPA: MBL fold metallo-hydrolase [Chitinophagaceae bacterium]|nr:MBL fold metallo-hydrolase [Chitinophagaceae bacterium]
MKIIPLSEGQFTVDQSKLFVPFDEKDDDLQQRTRGSLLVEIQPFVVITSNDILLLDTGLGFAREGVPQIYSNLINAGINPSEITKVLLSHLHKDHAGGIGVGQKLLFPSAQYYVQKNELDFAYKKGFPSFVTDDLEGLKNNDRVILLDGNGHIDDYIGYEITGAHSPYHQVFWIKDDNETVFFGGDEAPQLQQMRHRFVAKYDFDGRKAMELRQEWWNKGEKEKWSFLFYHDVKNPVWKF